MRTKISVAIVALVLATPSLSLAFGALAIDARQGDQWGWAVDHSTRAAADRRALSECGDGCSIVMRFSNTCAAYAADQARGSTAYGWSYGSNSSSAVQNRALRECRSRGGVRSNCIVRVWGCDRGGSQGSECTKWTDSKTFHIDSRSLGARDLSDQARHAAAVEEWYNELNSICEANGCDGGLSHEGRGPRDGRLVAEFRCICYPQDGSPCPYSRLDQIPVVDPRRP